MKKIRFEQEFNHNDYKGLHGVRFVPGADDLVWLTYCGNKNSCHQVFDLTTGSVLRHFETDQQCQDVAFLGDKAAVFARNDHIKGGKSKAHILSKKWKMFATAYVYQIPEDLHSDAPVFLSRWKGNIDAVKAYGDHGYRRTNS
ncbi:MULTISPECIES: hypothetical protein [Rhodobacterales]|uniref:hypothetical protein n=1 Tax=Rhodobacterales TaxID=204455 RepID=UPI0011BE21A6|nr:MULTISPECIES: hypothetical protein [Rhodobacterales]MDO6589313.1 hypothetical protein [Yoonia sp. 1_MG-2023]